MPKFLVTGGAGYIGSHTCKYLAAQGAEVVVYDNLSTGHRDFVRWGPLEEGDLRDRGRLTDALTRHRPDIVIHFAAASLVGESEVNPGFYYDNNVGGTLSLLQCLAKTSPKRLVVSSSCAVYGLPKKLPINEMTDCRPVSTYGATKLCMERMCEDFGRAHGIATTALRYFNACGADAEGEIGERHEPETHLIPLCLQALLDEGKELAVYGDDYGTADGTCERDYIHVTDLASAHHLAADRLLAGQPGAVFNLGIGQAYSVKQILAAVVAATGREVPWHLAPRRPGDPPLLVADAAKARRDLQWHPEHSGLENIIATAWRWHQG